MSVRLAGLAIAAVTAVSPALAGAETTLDRLKSLAEEKRRLEWENALLKQELAFASTPAPYIFLDLGARTIEFRVRGRTHKSYEARAIQVLRGDGTEIRADEMKDLFPAPIEVVEKAGGPPEIKPPDPDAVSDPNSGPARSDAGILGVDAPTDYEMWLQNDVLLEVRAVRPQSRWDRTREALTAVWKVLLGVVGGLLGTESKAPQGAPSAIVRLALDEATSKAFFHSVLVGEHIYFLPSQPRPLTLVASLSPTAPAPEPPAKKAAPAKKGSWRRGD